MALAPKTKHDQGDPEGRIKITFFTKKRILDFIYCRSYPLGHPAPHLHFFKTSKIRDCRVQSVVKSFQSLFLTPKPKFHRLRNQMNSSSKKMSQTYYFPRIFGFPSAMSHIHKSTKMRFPGNQPKMPHLHRKTTSSEMVVRDWYMTYFDRRYLIISKK